MKTPRDLLFSRHQTAAPKLDAIRREVVAQHFAAPGRAESAAITGFLARCWIELVQPYRQLWTGLTAIWVLLLIVNLSQRDTQTAGVTPPPTAAMMAFPDQEKMLRELLSDRSLPEEADRPRSFTPKPRSEVARVAAV